MTLVESLQPFSFNYTAFDQDAALDVAFSLYDVSSGSPVFLQQNIADYSAFGAYMSSFLPQSGFTYLAIGIVYTDNTFSTVDTSRAPSVAIFQTIQSTITYFGFAYGAYDQESDLDLEASIYNMVTGTPVFVTTASMAEVAFGVYFGSYNGVLGNSYQAISVVYTDGTFTTPDPNRAPSCDELESIKLVPNLVISGSANIIGQQLRAILVGD